MKILKLGLPLAVCAAALLVNSVSFAKPAYVKDTKKTCKDCHTLAKGGKEDKDLTDMGKYYRDHNHSLDGYKAK